MANGLNDGIHQVTGGGQAPPGQSLTQSSTPNKPDLRKAVQPAISIDESDDEFDVSAKKDALEEDNIKSEKNTDKKKSADPLKTIGKTSLAAKGAFAAYKGFLLMKMLLLLKQFGAMLVSAIKSLITSLVQAVTALAQSLVAVLVSFAGMLGVATSVVAVGSFGVVLLGVFSIGSMAINIADANGAIRNDVGLYDCGAEVSKAQKSANVTNPDTITLDQAKKVYSVFKQRGLHDYNIAGIVGNWAHESGIDPTGIEGIYDEPYSVDGPAKSAANKDLYAYTINNVAYNSGYYYEGKYLCGIGLGQWTADRHQFLQDFAKKNNKNWWDLDLQLAFCITPRENGGDTRSGMFAANGAGWPQEASPSSATQTFMSDWEGISNSSLSARIQSAEMWATEFASWSVDINYANSILAMTGSTQSGATSKAVNDAVEKCNKSDLLTQSGDYLWPCEGTLTSPFGNRVHPITGEVKYHAGIDIANPVGTPIYATGNGVVLTAGWYGGYGNAVVLDLGGELQVLYGHLSSCSVKVGQTVKKGEEIGKMGSTGNSTGSHLHFEFRLKDEAVDPYNYVKEPEGIVKNYDA